MNSSFPLGSFRTCSLVEGPGAAAIAVPPGTGSSVQPVPEGAIQQNTFRAANSQSQTRFFSPHFASPTGTSLGSLSLFTFFSCCGCCLPGSLFLFCSLGAHRNDASNATGHDAFGGLKRWINQAPTQSSGRCNIRVEHHNFSGSPSSSFPVGDVSVHGIDHIFAGRHLGGEPKRRAGFGKEWRKAFLRNWAPQHERHRSSSLEAPLVGRATTSTSPTRKLKR